MEFRRHQTQRFGELFEIGALADALNRTPATVRTWERKGIIPPSPLRRPRQRVEGQRRLYPAAFIEVSRHIAESEGVRFGRGRIPRRFSKRLYEAWRLLGLQLPRSGGPEPPASF